MSAPGDDVRLEWHKRPEGLSREQSILEVARVRVEKEASAAEVKRLRAEKDVVDAKIDDLEVFRRAMEGRGGDQSEVLRSWERAAKHFKVENTFVLEGAEIEDYVVDLLDFKRWTLRAETLEAEFVPHAEGRIFNYTLFEPVELTRQFEVLGVSWRQGPEHPAVLVRARLVPDVDVVDNDDPTKVLRRASEVRISWPAIYHLGKLRGSGARRVRESSDEQAQAMQTVFLATLASVSDEELSLMEIEAGLTPAGPLPPGAPPPVPARRRAARRRPPGPGGNLAGF